MRPIARLRAAACIATVFSAGCATAPPRLSGPCRMLHVTDVPFAFVGEHIMVPALVNGRAALFMFDTGAAVTTVTPTAAVRLRLSDRGTGAELHGIGGTERVSLATARTFALGRLLGFDFPLFVNDRSSGNNAVGVDGWLSTNFLAHYDVDISFPDRMIRFFKPVGDCSRPSVFLDGEVYRVPMLDAVRPAGRIDAHIRVPVTIRGRVFTALFDTGAPHTLLFREAAAGLGLSPAASRREQSAFYRGFGPRVVQGAVRVFEPISIGEITFDHLPVHIIDQSPPGPNTDMLLGADFVSHVHVWISYSSASLVMQYPVRPSPRLPTPPVSAPAKPSLPAPASRAKALH